MHLLVTRPRRFAIGSVQKLAKAGHTAEINTLLRPRLNGQPSGVPDPGGVVVTSRNGLRALLRWPVASKWHNRAFYAVGPSTAELARKNGFRNARPGTQDVLFLVEQILNDYAPQNGPLLYASGREISYDLPSALAVASIDTIHVEAYFMERAEALSDDTQAALKSGSFDAVMIYSLGAAEVLVELVEKAGLTDELAKLSVVAISERVSEPLVAQGIGRLCVADKPNEAGMLAAVESLRQGGAD